MTTERLKEAARIIDNAAAEIKSLYKQTGIINSNVLRELENFSLPEWQEPFPPDKISPLEPKGEMSLQECKNKVAQSHDYKNWSELTNIAFDQELNFDLYKDCLDEAAELYAKQFKGERWVSAETTPEPLERVLIYSAKIGIQTGYFGNKGDWFCPFGRMSEKVTYWHPLPPSTINK